VHSHAHAHALDIRRGDSRRRMWIAFGINAGMLAVEAIGGILTGSLAVLADAGHLLSDAGSIALALFAAAPATPRAEPDPSTRAGRFRPRPGGRAVGILGLAGVALVAVAVALLVASVAGYALAAAALRPVEAMRRRAASIR